MARRKKTPASQPAPPSDASPGPAEASTEAPPQAQQPPPESAPLNGQMQLTQPIEEPSLDLERLVEDAKAWASECGLKPPFALSAPEKMPYPGHGHGYAVTVHEETGKCRLGTARFNAEGGRAMWTIDGAYAG